MNEDNVKVFVQMFLDDVQARKHSKESLQKVREHDLQILREKGLNPQNSAHIAAMDQVIAQLEQ